MPSITLARPFSSRFSSSHRAATASGVVGHRVAEDVGVASDELRAHVVGDTAQVEEPLLGAEVRVEDDLEQEVAQLLFGVACGAVDRRRPGAVGSVERPCQRLERVERLVGLL